MSIKKKEECLLKYVGREHLKPIGDVVKTKDEFRNNYTKHDVAVSIVLPRLRGSFQLGEDLRRVRGQMEGECPDYYYKTLIRIFAYDLKAKTSLNTFGWCNERAYKSYRRIALECNIDVYLIYCLVSKEKPYAFLNEIGHSDINWDVIKKIGREEVHNKNPVVILEWKEGLP